MKKILSTLLLASASIVASAQSAWSSQNMFTRLLYNPAFAGMENSLDFGNRSQWTQFPGYPTTFLLTGNVYLPCIHSGIGVTDYQVNLGFQTTNELKLSYSYHIALGTNTLGIGASYGYNMLSTNGPWGIPPHFNTSDIGVGIYYKTLQGFYVGVSTAKLTDNTLTYSGSEYSTEYQRYYYLTTGYVFQTNSECDIVPDAYIQSAYKQFNYQLNTRILFSKSFWFGGGYQITSGSYASNVGIFVGLLGIAHEFKNGMGFRVSYSYDFPNSLDQVNATGTNEIHLQYYIPTKPKEAVK